VRGGRVCGVVKRLFRGGGRGGGATGPACRETCVGEGVSVGEGGGWCGLTGTEKKRKRKAGKGRSKRSHDIGGYGLCKK